MKTIYKEYFQKSKVFLYPLLEIKKGSRYVPIETYVQLEDVFFKNDYIFICAYSHEQGNEDFADFANKVLRKHSLYRKDIFLNDLHLFIFNMQEYKHDIDRFLNGKYSRFSQNTKKKILTFFGKTGTISKYVESYIYPENYYQIYSELLNVDYDILESVGELCDRPNLKKETFTVNVTKKVCIDCE